MTYSKSKSGKAIIIAVLVLLSGSTLHTVKASETRCEVSRLSDSNASLKCIFPTQFNMTNNGFAVIKHTNTSNGTAIASACDCGAADCQCLSDEMPRTHVANVHNQIKVVVPADSARASYSCKIISHSDFTEKTCILPDQSSATESSPSLNTTQTEPTCEDSCPGESTRITFIIVSTLSLSVNFVLTFVLLWTCIQCKGLKRQYDKLKKFESPDELEPFQHNHTTSTLTQRSNQNV